MQMLSKVIALPPASFARNVKALAGLWNLLKLSFILLTFTVIFSVAQMKSVKIRSTSVSSFRDAVQERRAYVGDMDSQTLLYVLLTVHLHIIL